MTQNERIHGVYRHLRKAVNSRHSRGESLFLCNILESYGFFGVGIDEIKIIRKDIFNEMFSEDNSRWAGIKQDAKRLLHRASLSKDLGEEESVPVWWGYDYDSRMDFLNRMLEKYSNKE